MRRILHRPVPRSDAEQRMTDRHPQRLLVLHESSAATPLLIVRHPLNRLEVRISAAPAQRVRNQERGSHAATGQDENRGEPSPRPAITTKRARNQHSHEKDEHDRGEREPGRARTREDQRCGDDRDADRSKERSCAEGGQHAERQPERRDVSDEVSVAERPSRHAAFGEENDVNAVGLQERRDRGEHNGQGQSAEERRSKAGIAQGPRSPEDQGAGNADGQRSHGQPAVGGHRRGESAEQQIPDEEQIDARHAQPRDGTEGEQSGRDRGQMERQLFRKEETIQLERVERRHDEHDRDRTELHDPKRETVGGARSDGLCIHDAGDHQRPSRARSRPWACG